MVCHNVQKLPVRPGFFGTVSFWGRPRCLSAAPSCKEAFRGSQDPLRSFQCRQQSIVSARDDVSTPTEGHNGCGKRASRLFQPTCTSVHEHDHKQMGTQSCPSEYARSLPTESPRLRERSKTLASSQKAPFARAPLWMQSMSTARPTHPGTCTMRFVPDRTRTADEVTPNSATLADLQLAAKHSMRGAGSSRLAPAIRRVGRFVSGEHFSASEQELVSRNAQYRLSDPPQGRQHRVFHRCLAKSAENPGRTLGGFNAVTARVTVHSTTYISINDRRFTVSCERV